MTQPIFKFALRKDLQDDVMFLPTRSEPNATGWDVRAAMEDRQPLVVKPGQYIKIPLGFRAFVQEGWWYEIKPRSSSFAKKHLHALYGTIDQDFENEAVWAAQYLCDAGNIVDLTINFGDAIAQIIPVKRKEMVVESISNDEYDKLCKERNGVRKTAGWGSSG